MSVQSKHLGRKYLRNALDTFSLQGPNGEHHCLVHEPMLENTHELLYRNPSRRFTEELLKLFLWRLLTALDYLHTDAHIIHTGKQEPRSDAVSRPHQPQTSVFGTFFLESGINQLSRNLSRPNRNVHRRANKYTAIPSMPPDRLIPHAAKALGRLF